MKVMDEHLWIRNLQRAYSEHSKVSEHTVNILQEAF